MDKAYPADDNLRLSLYSLCRFFKLPVSETQLLSGLPLENGYLSPALLERAAQRANLSASLLSRPLQQIQNTHLPALLLLKGQQACVLLEKTAEQAKILLPETGDGVQMLALKDLENTYTGQVLFAQPQYRFDQRSQLLQHKKSTGHWYWRTLWQSWPLYSEVLLASLLINLFALAAPLFVMNVYDRVVPNHAQETLWVLAIGASLVFVFDWLMRTLRGYFIDVAGKRADVELSASIFSHLLNTRTSAQPKSAGAFANHLQEFDSFRDFFTSATLATVIDLPFSLLFISVIWLIGGDLVWVPLLAMPLVLLVGFLIQIPLRKVVEQTLRAGAQKQASLVETLNGLDTVRACNAESQQQYRWEQLSQKIAQSSLKSRFISASAVNFSILTQQLAYVLIVVLGVYQIMQGSLTMGGLIACTILSGRALAPLAQIAALLTRYHQSATALKALSQIMQQPVERPEASVENAVEAKSFLHRPQLQGNIQFQQVQFQYPGQQQAALQNLSLQIQAGERIGIIGRVGSGKSTIARLLLGLYPPDQGMILFDSLEARQIDPSDIRQNIGYVPQEVTLFFGTLRENLCFGLNAVSDEQLLQAAQQTGVDQLARQHPQGFDMPISERGSDLSGGQRQAIAVTRALLTQPQILLLDEPSNAMDNQAETQFKQQLQSQLDGRTLVLITHRASLLTLVERLIVLDKGQVVADGEKQQVLDALASGQIKIRS
ncbi:type I secretion system permease/ATPase [Candidatus Venteria ishoeyi]|uniref:Toxin RTX-I translocation ATP-binding protein n=1 Tax=Candidatus Venteria ishoeyi TaxID=1899563 RepID=A0A1H6F5X9_9GAMM|nr:type I secretion system permease/ATPase [Candidatus Venteria ishoeyi]SEH04182.1 Toxin RTX-I translocation ATP-binding protein [Candidatus Venteria ishoeyi]SEH05577.1 Toxin RTX-I translocation ATP-binding protein [Candidatus Venteria ishoeyi]SEH05852.1 Toxin RTX-I translocation ATP-binding protein [Candidatus Venteria ishoeyi]